MQRRRFTREFKVEAARLVTERGVSVAQAARDLDVHENVLRKWVKALAGDATRHFPAWSDEARAARDRAAASRGGEAQGGARHPKKGRSLLREGSDMKLGGGGGVGRWHGNAKHWASGDPASNLAHPVPQHADPDGVARTLMADHGIDCSMSLQHDAKALDHQLRQGLGSKGRSD